MMNRLQIRIISHTGKKKQCDLDKHTENTEHAIFMIRII